MIDILADLVREVMIGSPDRPLSKVRVRLVARHIGVADRWPDMAVSIQVRDATRS